MQKRKIILASRSPRRKKLLEQVGLEFEIVESNFDEDSVNLADPIESAKFLALKKAEDVARQYDDAIIIAADTFIIFDNQIIGKPRDSADAKKILKNFSGREHKAISGLAIIDTKSGVVVSDAGEAVVKVRNLGDEEIDDYVRTGEPLEMAGGYGLLDMGGFIAESVTGDFFSVIGLPLSKVYVELRKMGAI